MSSYAKMWFGTEYKMQWIDCPLQGADVSPMGWSAEGTLPVDARVLDVRR